MIWMKAHDSFNLVCGLKIKHMLNKNEAESAYLTCNDECRHTIAAITTIIAVIAIIALLLAQLTTIANNKYKQMNSIELK